MITYRRCAPPHQPFFTALIAWEKDGECIHYAVETIERTLLREVADRHGWRSLRAFWATVKDDLRHRVYNKERTAMSAADRVDFCSNSNSFARTLLRGMLLVGGAE